MVCILSFTPAFHIEVQSGSGQNKTSSARAPQGSDKTVSLSKSQHTVNCLGAKYAILTNDDRTRHILGDSELALSLLTAAYASSMWDKIACALKLLDKFGVENNITVLWPLDSITVSKFIEWMSLKRLLSPSSITSYMSHIKTVHMLRNLDSSACRGFVCKTLIRGAKNLEFYKDSHTPSK